MKTFLRILKYFIGFIIVLIVAALIFAPKTINTTNKITINKPANEVWKVLAHDFDKADLWLNNIPKSTKKTVGTLAYGAPMVGRTCELSTDPNGPKANEAITKFNEEIKYMEGIATFENAPYPVIQNNFTTSVTEIVKNKCEVTWTSSIELKALGRIMYPVLKPAFKANFNALLEELKYYSETGKQHPRKVENDKIFGINRSNQLNAMKK